MTKDKEYYLIHHFYTTDPDEARQFAYQIVKEYGLKFSIYNNENSDMLTIEFTRNFNNNNGASNDNGTRTTHSFYQ